MSPECAELVLLDQSDSAYEFELVGHGIIPDGAAELCVTGISVRAANGAASHSAKIQLAADQSVALNIPTKLLFGLGGSKYRFRTAGELRDLAEAEWVALKDRVRRRLAAPIETNATATSAQGLFGVKAIGTADLQARLFLNPALVDGDLPGGAWALKAEGFAAIDFSYRNASGSGLDVGGRLLAAVTVSNDDFANWIAWDLGFDLPDLPGLDLKLPRLPFDVSWFDGDLLRLPSMSIALDAASPLSLFSLALPPQLQGMSFGWADPKKPPRLEINVNDGRLALQVSPPSDGVLTIGGQPWVKVGGFSLAFIDAKFSLEAELTVSPTPVDIGPVNYSGSLPFKVEFAASTFAPTFGDIDLGGSQVLKNASLSILFQCDRIVISAIDDPNLLIAFAIEAEIRYDAATKTIKTTVKRLRIVEPYPIELVMRAGEAAGQLIRLLAAIPVPAVGAPKAELDGFFALLDRICKLLASAAKWIAARAGEAAAALAGLAESVFDALMRLPGDLARLGGAVVSHVAIEFRLDPRTYALRQIVLMPAGDDAVLSKEMTVRALGFDITLDAALRPSLVVDLGPEQWVGLVVQPIAGSQIVIGSDLWLDKETTPQQAMGTTGEDGTIEPAAKRLIALKVKPTEKAKTDDAQNIVIAAIQRGRPRFFQTFTQGGTWRDEIIFQGGNALALREVGQLRDAAVRFRPSVDPYAVIEISLDAPDLENRLLSLLASAGSDAAGDGFLDKLKQKVVITSVKYGAGKGFSISVDVGVKIHLDDDFVPETTFSVDASLRDLSVKISGGEKIYINSKENEPDKKYHPLGFDLTVSPKVEVCPGETYKQFYIDLSHGGESLGLADEAKALLTYGKVSTNGKGLQFEVPTFRVGRDGFDLEAKVLPEPVKLGGVDMPFRFTSGQLAIKGSRFGGGSLTGAGQLPPALVGEANATVALQLGAGTDGNVVVKGATARLDKSGDPIRCTSTRFDLTITELGFDFVDAGSYHFYFLLTGSAVFKPGGSEYATGLLKNFKDVSIKLDKAPLAADPRVLMSALSFQVKVDPPKRTSFFDIFDFELRGFGFHPSARKFGGAPAMSISGQVKFTEGADRVSPNFEFHSLWIAGPKPGSSKPQIRFDGLTVGLRTGAVNVEATAIAVDGALPDLYDPGILPKDVTAEGFLASGRLDIEGWASMSGAMGFLEMRKAASPTRPAFFIYGQAEKQAEPIDTPVGRIYLREFGFGFGHRYTLAGISQAEKASSPQQLTRILDEVSKYQGNLNSFKAWQPTYDNDDLTLALRGMFALSAATERQAEYRPEEEAILPNPVLFDIVAAFRTDFTFLINLRAWLSVNYHDWVSTGLNESWKSRPTMSGYLYFSVPRKEFLGRFISDGKGYVGTHPKLPKELVTAIENTRFSATLYIRPGLFHFELGWPYELGFTMGKPDDRFYLDLKGGLVHRVEDSAVLNGIAFKAQGSVFLEGRVGGSSLGAAAVARANFAIEAQILSYLSLKDFGESFYYGYMRLDVSVGVSVEVWLSFKIFGKRISLSASFSLHLAVSIALEAVIGPDLLGGRADVSIGVRAFGRSLSVRIALSHRDDQLAVARARVARFMEMGLAAQIPDKAQDGQRIETTPKASAPRGESARLGDAVLENDIGAEPLPQEAEDENFDGRAIEPSDFWAMLYPTREPTLPDYNPSGAADRDWFVMQLIPRDQTDIGPRLEVQTAEELEQGARRSTFFASPMAPFAGFDEPGHALVFDGGLQPADGAPYLGRIDVDAQLKEVTIASGGTATSRLKLDATVARDADGRNLQLGKLLQSLFLGQPDKNGVGGRLQEPGLREVSPELVALFPDVQSSAKQLEKAGRSRAILSRKQQREAEIEDARSAILAALAETAGVIAASGDTAGVWPAALPEIDARHFGLTYLVNGSALKQLFPLDGDLATPPAARFGIRKSDVASGAIGAVALFNPPERMFRRAKPSFTPIHTIDAQGIKLNWDLEPAWGASRGAYDDPEFHLKHYRIRRIVRGIPGEEYRADFLVKAGSAIRYETSSDGNATKVHFHRPDFQFVDDLRRQEDGTGGSIAEDIPEVLRRLILGQATDEDWKNSRFGPLDARKIDVFYEIVPVDNAGTSDFGEGHKVDGFKLIETLPAAPREATLQVVYAGMPSHSSASSPAKPKPTPPRLRLGLKPGMHVTRSGPKLETRTETPVWPDEVVYLLRIAEQAISPSGGYGADAVDEARRRPDQHAIDRLGAYRDVYLQMVKVGAEDDHALEAEYSLPGAADPMTQYYAVTAYAASANVSELPRKNDKKSDLGILADALGVANAPAGRRQGRRVFMATVASSVKTTATISVDPARRSEWTTISFNLAIEKAKSAKEKAIAMSSIVELLEQPVHYEFKTLERQDMRVESGRVNVVHPSAQARLGAIEYLSLRDAERRTATRLEWNADPASLQHVDGAGGDPDIRTIGGYDVFCVDPDALPGRGSVVDEMVAGARPMGRLALLPAEMDGLDPPGFGDFGRIESAYPSDTLRLASAARLKGTSSLRKAPWYSAADTTAMFPMPAIRRSMMADPDEGVIAALFAGGRPDAIRVSIPAWRPSPDKAHPSPLAGWEIGIEVAKIGGARAWDEYPDAGDDGADEKPNGKPDGSWLVTYEPRTGRFAVPMLRRLLQNLRLSPIAARAREAHDSEQEVLRLRVAEPDFLPPIGVLVEALRRGPDGRWVVVASQDHRFDPMPALHPILADALAFIQFDHQERKSLSAAKGKIYRRYAVAPDANPEIAAKSFTAYLDEVPPERDPHGWGALRTLGLAAGFRLYDTETGHYVRFGGAGGLQERVKLAFERALSRYADGGARDNGQPFLDLLTQPWGNVKLAWFDGGNGDFSSSDVEALENEVLAVAQIALRPRPDRLGPAGDNAPSSQDRCVRYFAVLAPGTSIHPDPWTITQAKSFDSARYDVLTVARTVVSQRPVRLTPDAPSVDFFEPRPALLRYTKDGRPARLVAVLRETRISAAAPGPGALIVAGQAYECQEIVQPAAFDALAGGDPAEDVCFGKFERLSASDWGRALFRRSNGGAEIDVHESMTRLALYAGRRFAPLTFPIAAAGGATSEVEEEAARRRAELADAAVSFWSRFVDRCALGWGQHAAGQEAAGPDPLAIFVSLGTVADPGQWRRAPNRAGTVSVTMVDADRRGARRKFAVRPFGRYEQWSKAAPTKIDESGKSLIDRQLPVGLEGAFGKTPIRPDRTYFVDATLPRTEPLEKPVILSSVTHRPASGMPGRLELVIAHGSDMVLAQSNRRNAAMLAPLDISVGFWREFAHMPWLSWLQKKHMLELQPMDQLGSLDNETDLRDLTITRQSSVQRLSDLRQRVPDAWLGSTMVSTTNLPYFFRIHALVHASAGIVVSEQVGTTFEEGFYQPNWPYDLETLKYRHRETSREHRYRVDRQPNPNLDGVVGGPPEVTVITFDLAAIRFVDCMTVEDAEIWFGKNGNLWSDAFKAVAHLPEPGVSYRIVTETCVTMASQQREEVLARTPEIEVLPNPPSSASSTSIYLLQQSGARYSPNLFGEKQGDRYEAEIVSGSDTKLSWRIEVPVRPAREPDPVTVSIAIAEVPAVEAALLAMGDPPVGLSPAIAALHVVPVTWSGDPPQSLWQSAIDALSERTDCPEALPMLAAVAAMPDSRKEGTLNLLLPPAALAEPAVTDALAGLTGAAPIPGPLTTLVLRRPPKDTELAQFPKGGASADALRAKVYRSADIQLFGDGRRPAVMASKGSGVPLTDRFLPREEASVDGQ